MSNHCWECPNCKARKLPSIMPDDFDCWRWDGQQYAHRCPTVSPQAGHFECVRIEKTHETRMQWSYRPEGDSDGFLVGTDHWVVDGWCDEVAIALNEQEARLIAAAPDLLTTCELFLLRFGDMYDNGSILCREMAADIREAVEKARGMNKQFALSESEKPPENEPMLKWFAYDHLPTKLQTASKPFCDLALSLCSMAPSGPERTNALRKLLEAKDAAVRSVVCPGG